MLDIHNIEILRSSVCSLKETSKSDPDGSVFYMTESLLDVVNFDVVKDKYIAALAVPEAPKSNDAFYASEAGEMYFIEFKSGVISREKTFEIRLKIFDSLLILTDIAKVDISDTRQSLSYILVYNETKNPRIENEKEELQVSPSRTEIAKHISKKGQKEFIRFSLERFQTLYFKNVFTVTEEEFEDKFVKKWVRQV